MSYLILNAAMIPNEGTFSYRVIDRGEATVWLAARRGRWTSFVGYPQTRRHLESLLVESGMLGREEYWPIELNREKCVMAPGDEALVCRLAYRLASADTKGQIQPESWEYGVIKACGVRGYHCATCAGATGKQCGIG